MNILWLVNIPLPEVSRLLNQKPSPFGGWLINASKDLALQKNVELSITFPSKTTKSLEKISGERINYYPFRPIKNDEISIIENNQFFKSILQDIKPDVVHIYGTEFAHTLSMVNACNSLGIETVISIQGLVSIYSKHMYANLPFRVIYGFTLINMIRKNNVYGQKVSFERRGKNEIKAIECTKHVIGRTTWDKACTNQINPDVKYHFCNETLREEFYKYEWNLHNCERHSIFLSQGGYSIKGVHYVLEALPIILRSFPDAKIYIGGQNIIKSETLKDKLLKTYYAKYIKKTMQRLNLTKNVFFTGPLDEISMCQRYLKSNVFVCPSSIENSPNSLGEAMILGVPCVASDVGGVSDMLLHKLEGFVYQSDASYMLAYYVCEIFKNENIALKFSKNARRHALRTHDRDENNRNLIKIYHDIHNLKLKKD